jgi:acyl-CoA synthetase (AMP-forming)/AMP-acid ligase II
MGAPAIAGWGLTESPINTMMELDSPDDKKATTEERRAPGSSCARSRSTARWPSPAKGELQCAQVCLGYLDATLDADALSDDWVSGERWFRTGDLGVIDDEGYVTITGRLKDIIIRKGENISAKEIEDLLFAHPKVVDVAVVSVPTRRAASACAVVVAARGRRSFSR